MSYIQIQGGTAAGGGGIAVSLSGNNTSGALALVSTGTLRLAGGNNVTLSQNGQSLTISAGAGGGTFSVFENFPIQIIHSMVLSSALAQSSLDFSPLFIPVNLSATQMMNLYSISVSTSSNSSFAAVFSHSAGIYTLTGSTLNLITASSASTNFQFSNTSNNSTASLNNLRAYTMPLAFNATPGNYWIGNLWITSTTNANWATLFPVLPNVALVNMGGTLGQATTAPQAILKGVGWYSAQTAALPASLNISADILSGSNLTAIKLPYMQFQGF